MKKRILLLLTATLFTACNVTVDKQPLGYVPDYKNVKVDQVLNKKEFLIGYSYAAKGAIYVSYTITKEQVNTKNIRQRPYFYKETNIPKEYRVLPEDYIHAMSSNCIMGRVDRGHLAPDADFDYNQTVLNKTYSMANISPQLSILNRGYWADAEKRERYLANKYNKVFVVNIVQYNQNILMVKEPIDNIDISNWTQKQIDNYKKYSKQLLEKHILIPTNYYKKINYKKEGYTFSECYKLPNNYAILKNAQLERTLLMEFEIPCEEVPSL